MASLMRNPQMNPQVLWYTMRRLDRRTSSVSESLRTLVFRGGAA